MTGSSAAILVVIATVVGKVASAFVHVPSSSTFVNTFKSSRSTSLQADSMKRNYMETFREQDNRQIPNMPGTNPTHRRGYMETFREQDNRQIPNMPGTNPNYRQGYMETFREQNNRQVPFMPGTNPTYRRGYMETFREQRNRQLPYMPEANPNYRPISSGRKDVSWYNRGSNRNTNSQVINGRPTFVSTGTVEDSSPSRKDQDAPTDSALDPTWVDRELVKLCTMGRLAMEQELYNTHGVSQLPPDCTHEELACYLLKARLISQPNYSTSTNNNNSIKSYNNDKYPSYNRAKTSRSLVDNVSMA